MGVMKVGISRIGRGDRDGSMGLLMGLRELRPLSGQGCDDTT
jgi:hypothetical protein